MGMLGTPGRLLTSEATLSDMQMNEFDERLRRIDRRHKTLARGFVLSVGRDGLIVARPDRSRFRFPWRVLLFLLVAMMAFKVMVHVAMGPEAYSERLALLAQGTAAERVTAYVLHADPVTLWLSGHIGALR